MRKPIGLGAPFVALICFGLLYNPYLTPYLPKVGPGELITSPQTFFFLAVLAIAWRRRLGLRDIGLRFTQLPRQLLLGVGLGLSPAALTGIVALILMGAHGIYPFLPRPIFGGTPVEIHFDAYTLVILLVMAPISEELFFRGILLRALREHYSATFSVIFSAVIFMGGHGLFSIGPLLLGLITAPITLRTGSVIPGIIFHVIANAYGPLLVAWFPNLYRYLDILFQ